MIPLDDAAWPPEIERLRAGFAGKLNVYRVMAHNPALLAAWENLRNHVVLDSALTPGQREVVILRVGHYWRSTYEWGQHVVRGREAGLSDAQIEAARADPGGWPAGDTNTLLMRAVDLLLATGALSPTVNAALTSALGAAAVLDVMATVGMYTTLAFIVKTTATPLEVDIEALAQSWEDRNSQ